MLNHFSAVVAIFVIVGRVSGREVCCPNSGCFNNQPPFQFMPLPQCASDITMFYKMYTRTNPMLGQFLNLNTVPNVFSGMRRTVFISHGYVSDTNNLWMTKLKDALLNKEDMNVVLIDWRGGSMTPFYMQAASDTRTVGAHTALIIQRLLREPNTNSNNFWCIGHSLGSHVCGHTGLHMPKDNMLGRITGMDPAGPGFELNPDVNVGLNPTAANFVDVIHTDKVYGTQRTLGHIDFYPTGYEYRIDLGMDSSFKIGPICESVCMHHRSIDFMLASINGGKDCLISDINCKDGRVLPFSAEDTCTEDTQCTAHVGFNADQSCKDANIFYLKVNDKMPFC